MAGNKPIALTGGTTMMGPIRRNIWENDDSEQKNNCECLKANENSWVWWR